MATIFNVGNIFEADKYFRSMLTHVPVIKPFAVMSLSNMNCGLLDSINIQKNLSNKTNTMSSSSSKPVPRC